MPAAISSMEAEVISTEIDRLLTCLPVSQQKRPRLAKLVAKNLGTHVLATLSLSKYIFILLLYPKISFDLI